MERDIKVPDPSWKPEVPPIQSATCTHPWCFVVIQGSRNAEVNDFRSALTILHNTGCDVRSFILVIYLARSVSVPLGSTLAVLGY